MRSLSMALLLLATVVTAFTVRADIAPQPESFRLLAYYQIGSENFREVEVSCSNRNEGLVYKREQHREWCVGGPGSGECFKDNISAAKRACENTVDASLAER